MKESKNSFLFIYIPIRGWGRGRKEEGNDVIIISKEILLKAVLS